MEDTDIIIHVGRSDEFLGFKVGNITTYIKYSRKLNPMYKNILNVFSKEKYVELDRIYLRDSLKHLIRSEDTITVSLNNTNNSIELSNQQYSQSIMYMGASQNFIDGESFSFNIRPSVLNSAIIGDDNNMVVVDPEGNVKNTTIFMYFTKDEANNSYVMLGDTSGNWFTALNVKVSVK
jgi:hypothetical protein